MGDERSEENEGRQDTLANARRELLAVNEIVSVLQGLSPESVTKVLRTVTTFLGVEGPTSHRPTPSRPEESSSHAGRSAPFSEDRSISPKEFMLQKRPLTDVERIACLAYYLTHYRNMPTFKTIDLSTLNTEAAQIKFSNAAFSANNAVGSGFLVSAPNGTRQLSAGGELFVQALPDRAAAREAMAHLKRGRKLKRNRGGATGDESAEE